MERKAGQIAYEESFYHASNILTFKKKVLAFIWLWKDLMCYYLYAQINFIIYNIPFTVEWKPRLAATYVSMLGAW